MDRQITQVLRTAVVALLVLGCFFVLRPFIAATLFAGVVCVTTWPLYRRIFGRWSHRPSLAAFGMTLLLTLVVLVPMIVLAASLADSGTQLVNTTQALLQEGAPEPPAWLKSLPLLGGLADNYWHELAGSREQLLQAARQLYEPLKTFLLQAGALAGQGALQLALVLFIAFFLYRDGEALGAGIRRSVRRLGGDFGLQLLTMTRNTVMGVMIGIVGTAAAQAVVAVIGLLIAGVPGVLLLGAATFFLSMIPIGPPLVWGGAAAWLFAQNQPGWGIFMIVYGLLVISSVDNFVKPLLISRSASLPILLIALGVLGGALAFGFIGIFLGPALLAIGLVLLQHWAGEPFPSE